MTGCADVLDALAAAVDVGLAPVKINTVLMRGVNDHEAPDLLRFACDHGYHLRFIEQMPLDAGHTWTGNGWSPPTRSWSGCRREFTPDPARRGARTARPPNCSTSTAGPARSASSRR